MFALVAFFAVSFSWQNTVTAGIAKRTFEKTLYALRTTQQTRRNFLDRTHYKRLDWIQNKAVPSACIGMITGAGIIGSSLTLDFANRSSKICTKDTIDSMENYGITIATGSATILLLSIPVVMAPCGTAAVVGGSGFLYGIAKYHEHKKHTIAAK